MQTQSSPAAAVALSAAFQTITDSGAPIIIIGFDGSIKQVSGNALGMMGYTSAVAPDTSFFSLIHKNQLYTVMRDVADIICRGKQSAKWLLRLKSSNGTWKWFNTEVRKSHACDECIYIMLRSV